MTDREDVITLLERQHKEIRRLFGEVEQAKGDARGEAFRDLVRLLSVHETAEEMLVHPEVRQEAGGRPVVEDRLAEEHRAKVLLSTLGWCVDRPGAGYQKTVTERLTDGVAP